MPQLRIATRARNDLGEIVRYIAKDSPENAERVSLKILKKCQLIASRPMLTGRIREEFAPGLRSGLCRPYLIFYRIADNAVDILYIIHCSRDIKRILSDS